MKTSTVKNRSMASALALASAAIFGIAGIAHAQYGGSSSGQGSSAGQSGSSAGQSGSAGKTPSESESLKQGKEGMDQGQVDQRKRVERGADPKSPSPDSHVPDFPRDKEGRPMKDLKDEQGGPIGPN
ncbi:MAG TPA: hypothetical protein VGP12_02090 [Nitrosospira sp.]|jgi:hypothetical protein|nr:hypothetical protein [Nitrosospira sp.]